MNEKLFGSAERNEVIMKKLLILLLVICLSASCLLACNPENYGDNSGNDSSGNTGDNSGSSGSNEDNEGGSSNGDSVIPGVEDGYFDPEGWTKPE